MTCSCLNKLPDNLREVVKCVEPTLFHKVVRPATLGDDTITPATDLDYRNVLLTYEANNHSYLYSSDGVPTFISLGETNTEELEQAIQELQAQLAVVTTDVDENTSRIEQLSTDVSSNTEKIQENTNTITEVQTQANQNATEISGLKTELEGVEANQADLTDTVGTLGNATVVKDVSVSGDASTVTLTKSVGPLNGEVTETAIPLPVASSTEAGVMNPATYNAVQENSENIDSILGGAVVVSTLPENPTQDQLTNAWKTATGKIGLINRASIYDDTNKLVWYYYENANEWKSMPAGDAAVSVSIATNDTAGIVKGSTEDGQVAVEADGSMSLNGYDGMQHDIDNLSQLVAGIEVPKTNTYIATSNTSSSIIDGFVQDSIGKGVRIGIRAMNVFTGAVDFGGKTLLEATKTTWGVMSPSDKSKLDSLLEIKSLNDSLSLDENGQLSVVGGSSSSVNLLTAYSASPAEGDVYAASYVNGRLDASDIVFGNSIITETLGSYTAIAIGSKSEVRKPTNLGPSNSGGIAIGQGASVAFGSLSNISMSAVAVGRAAKTTSGSATAVGDGAQAAQYAVATGAGALATGKTYSVAIGCSAACSMAHSVAIGGHSKCARTGEVSVGGYAGTIADIPITRYLANVTAGELPTDAVNLQQMQDYVAENAGNPFTEMETARVKNLPPAVVTGFEDTTYGTDTITMHLDTKDLATGGVSVQELELEGATANTDEAGGHAGLMTAFQATQLAALAAGGAGGLTPDEVTKVQNLGTGSLTNMDGVLQTEEAVEIEFSRQNLVAGGTTTQTATISAATTEEAGVMTPTMVAQLNQLGDVATVLETLTTGAGV